ncbi:uncharacterized protein MONBRDRAFT_10705 [Monosiga brevicollis MX1]|uniref:FAD-binding domain-containing protein n=1 Tax=Monosiga brevicollis TaxID=81824 RepID=A9V700_MONBE|nr:uncharacterized protein MONBRDRAFT_10705 [Monosiga brevicollis MX1]EDQ86703.1 predicted protein [Monosiga brevicollis MX1]|eukprot:XP_001748539.1 hypothetical protein [Monosiga brevicollis MX1]
MEQATVQRAAQAMRGQPRVAVIGASLAGLSFSAILAHQAPHIHVSVFERASRTRDEGYGIDLDEDGMAAVKAANLLDKYPETTHNKSDVTKMYSATSKDPIFVMFMPSLLLRLGVKPGLESNRQALLDMFRASISSDIHYDTHITNIVPSQSRPGGATLLGPSGTPLGDFDLVVDAGGVRSPVRLLRLTDPVGLHFDKDLLFHGQIADPETSLPPEALARLGDGNAFYFTRFFEMAVQRYGCGDDPRAALFFRVRTDSADVDETFAEIGVPRRGPAFHNRGSAEFETLRKFMRQAAGEHAHPAILSTIDALDRVAVRGLYNHGSDVQLRSDNTLPLVCIGDAVRNIGLGGGGNVAMRDARELAELLAQPTAFDPTTHALALRGPNNALLKLEETMLQRHLDFVKLRDSRRGTEVGPPPPGADLEKDLGATFGRPLAFVLKTLGFVSRFLWALDGKR